MSKGIDYYIKVKEQNEKLSAELKKSISQIGYLRLAAFIVGVIVSAYTYSLGQYSIFAVVTILWIGLFIYLIRLHDKAIEKKKYSDALVIINGKGIDRVRGNWKSFEDNGLEFIEEQHPYSGDLDIIGPSSLFQWINSCATYMGRLKLKDYLLKPLKSQQAIKVRQEAIKELSGAIELRQKINAEGMLISSKTKNPTELLEWAETGEEQGGTFLEKVIINLLTVALFAIIFLFIFTDWLNYKFILAALAANIAALALGNKNRSITLDTIHSYKDGIKIYERILKTIQEGKFTSEAVKTISNNLVTKEGKKASEVINELKKISDFISDRRNMGYIIINIAFLLDYRCLSMLKTWKNTNGKYLRNWLEVVGEFEALSSLSNIAFENENWCFPQVSNEGFVVKAMNLGHPLLGERRVCNDITIKDQGAVLLITGSNMSGKSTFLRTVGINLVMSYCGAPVCAAQFSALIMDIYTCMRVSDNLEKSISSFYAEILRIKMIVKASKESNKVFFMLDEIFKGTNSIDRHQGATVLIKQLSASGASGMVSTHDLELGELDKEMPKLSNYHFQEHYVNGELKFDHKLRRGISTTRNALHIIKLAGIEVE